ncbi:hypothetical protein ACIUXG_19690 [Pseudomonas aeruginosa]
MNKANECTCPSGDGSLVHPCPAHPAVEQAGGDERAACNLWIAEQQLCQGSDISLFKLERNGALVSLHDLLRDAYQAGQARAALAQPSQSQYEASFEEWLANELEGEDGQPVPAAVCDIALARRAFNHWPKLEQPAKVGGVRFSAGVSSRLVVEAAQRLYEFESIPEKEAERIERLQAFREQLDPLNLAPHAEAFNEAPAEVLKPEQAERPEVVGVRYEDGTILSAEDCGIALEVCARVQTPLMTVAQHERIVEARWNRAMDLLLDHVSRISEKFKAERDAASKGDAARHAACGMEMDIQELKAKLAELEKQEPLLHINPLVVDELLGRAKRSPGGLTWSKGRCGSWTLPLYAAPPAQAQHSVPEGWMLVECGIWTQEQVDEMQKTVTRFRNSEFVDDRALAMAVADAGQCKAPEISLAELLAAAPGNSVPQAWLDVQAERRRQITAEGWTPEHDDEHADGQMAQAAGCYALHAGGIGTDWPDGRQNGAALFWPWDKDSWKPTTPRRDLVKACALALAEIERLDRAGISQSPQPGATTASS